MNKTKSHLQNICLSFYFGGVKAAKNYAKKNRKLIKDKNTKLFFAMLKDAPDFKVKGAVLRLVQAMRVEGVL